VTRKGDTFRSANYVPEFADVVHVDWSPSIGHEMVDPHYGLVISATLFDTAVGMVALVPITSKGGKVSSFELPIQSRQVNGVAVLSDFRSLDYTTRNIAFENRGPKSVAIEANKRIHLILPVS
jgi:mRNA-degrading endonuclease toxin of MazEF toxin-antitoxin module